MMNRRVFLAASAGAIAGASLPAMAAVTPPKRRMVRAPNGQLVELHENEVIRGGGPGLAIDPAGKWYHNCRFENCVLLCGYGYGVVTNCSFVGML